MIYLNEITGIEIWSLWLILAVFLLIVEIFMAVGFYVSFSSAAMIISLKIYILGLGNSYSDLWHWLGFAVLGIVLFFPIQVLFKKFAKNNKDISDY